MDKKVVSFIFSQINQILRGGLSVLFRKLFIILLILLSVPVIILIRALHPLILIRFGRLLSSRIGHFAANTELYLCNRDIIGNSKRTFDIFYYEDLICNQQLKKMWERTGKLRISPFTSFTQTLDRLNRLLPGSEKHMIVTSARDVYGLRARTKSHLSFTAQEEQFGRNDLRKLGIPDGSPFVCFHARDSSYLGTIYPNRKWHYHDYRDSNINSYIPAVEELARRGYFAVRMGKIVKKMLATSDPRIIDYATNSRNDFLDIYLAAKCRFFISSGTGMDSIPIIFRRPLAYVNYIPLKNLHAGNLYNLLIPKKLWLRAERRFLTFREILNSKIGNFIKGGEYEEAGVEVVDNTPEEITALAVEMDERLKGTWQTSQEDEELQQCFWNLFKLSEAGQVFLRIGADFLRQNQELLE